MFKIIIHVFQMDNNCILMKNYCHFYITIHGILWTLKTLK